MLSICSYFGSAKAGSAVRVTAPNIPARQARLCGHGNVSGWPLLPQCLIALRKIIPRTLLDVLVILVLACLGLLACELNLSQPSAWELYRHQGKGSDGFANSKAASILMRGAP